MTGLSVSCGRVHPVLVKIKTWLQFPLGFELNLLMRWKLQWHIDTYCNVILDQLTNWAIDTLFDTSVHLSFPCSECIATMEDTEYLWGLSAPQWTFLKYSPSPEFCRNMPWLVLIKHCIKLLVLFIPDFLLSTGTSATLQIIEQPKSEYVVENRPVTLGCRADGHTHSLITTWYKDGRPISTAANNPRADRMILPSGQLFFLGVVTTGGEVRMGLKKDNSHQAAWKLLKFGWLTK